MQGEPEAIKERYVERDLQKAKTPERYSILNPFVWLTWQEKQRAVIRWLSRAGIAPMEDKRLLDVGCGRCGNLHLLLKLGFRGENLFGSDLREDALEIGRRIRELFPEGKMRKRRIMLAPPLARCVIKISPSLYHVFNALPFLPTHVLCWIQKPAKSRVQ